MATRIQDLIDDGVPAREIAVLFRTNGQSQAFEAALADANIGFQLRGTERFFNRPEIRQALVQIRSAAKTLGDEPVRVPQQVRDMLSSLGYSARAPRSDSATRARWESLSALVSLADSMAHRAAEEDEEFTLQEFSDELERRAKAQEAPVMDGVTLASMHSAKGLEWDAVFLAGLSEGSCPSPSQTPRTVWTKNGGCSTWALPAPVSIWCCPGHCRALREDDPPGRARDSWTRSCRRRHRTWLSGTFARAAEAEFQPSNAHRQSARGVNVDRCRP